MLVVVVVVHDRLHGAERTGDDQNVAVPDSEAVGGERLKRLLDRAQLGGERGAAAG